MINLPAINLDLALRTGAKGTRLVADIEQLSLYGLGALATLLLGILGTRRAIAQGTLNLADDTMVFLIADNRVIDANFPARRLINQMGGALSEIDHLRQFLSQHFEEFEDFISFKEGCAELTAQSVDGQIQIVKQSVGSQVRLKIQFVIDGTPTVGDIHTLRAAETELETLRGNTTAAPFLLWRQNSNGNIVWMNKAYMDAAHSLAPKGQSGWPLPVLFPSLGKIAAPVPTETRRISAASSKDGAEAWYDCHISPIGKDVLLTAIPADEAVRAENRRREFTQTLTKTFAELAIGLAIFDRSRRLVLFNPALLDLTNLATEFLTSRPTLVGFLDQLRENRVMPEPRDYRSWRTSIAELEAAAVDGTYSETWSLADGQTYHVTGRPHPDGAVALLFEDISAEMSLTRHFRAEVEQYQAVIDAFEDAVALFSPAGEVAISNKAYRELWDLQESDFLVGDITEATRRWHEKTTPTPIWGDFRDFAQSMSEREKWSATVKLRDGRHVSCRFLPRPGGITMAIFRLISLESAGRLQKAV